MTISKGDGIRIMERKLSTSSVLRAFQKARNDSMRRTRLSVHDLFTVQSPASQHEISFCVEGLNTMKMVT